MKVMFVVPYMPNLIRVRPYQFIRALHRLGHDVTVATLWSGPDERRDEKHLRNMGVRMLSQQLSRFDTARNVLRAMPSGRPLQADYCWHTALASMLRTELDQPADGIPYDVVHVEHLRGACYGLALVEGAQSRTVPPVVWDSVDSISHLFAQAAKESRSVKSRIITRLELGRTRRYEGWLVRRFAHTVVTSGTDAEALTALANGKRAEVHVVPNGVDLEYFTPSPHEPPAVPTLVFSGKMSYHANVTAAVHLVREIMPLVWQEKPEVRVQLVGKDPTSEVRALASERVEITGTVPDLRPYLQRATLAVAPVPYGAGVQNKVLEAMACSAPVVASRQAASGLHSGADEALCVADGAEEFAATIVSLLDDEKRRVRYAATGRTFVEQHHSWRAKAAALVDIYKSAAERHVHPPQGIQQL